jgi:hypothetical protein
MPIYKFSLAEKRPELFRSCQLPANAPVPVSYEGTFLCDVDVPADGIIDIPVPDTLVSRMESDRVLVMIDTTSLIPHDALDDFQIVRITSIEIYDRN